MAILLGAQETQPLLRNRDVQDWFIAGTCEDWTPVRLSGECTAADSYLCSRFLCNGLPAALVTAEYPSGACQSHYGVFSDAWVSGDCGSLPHNLVRTCPLKVTAGRARLQERKGTE